MRALSFRLKESLGFKLLTAFIIVIIVVLSAYTFYAVYREGNKVRAELASEGDMLTGLLAYNARVGVFAENPGQLKDVAEGIITQRHVVMVALYSNDGRPLYLTQKDQTAQYPAPDLTTLSEKDAALPHVAVMTETRTALDFVKPVVLELLVNTDAALYFGEAGERKREKTIGYARVLLEKESLHREIQGIIIRNAVSTLIFIIAGVIVIFVTVKRVTRPLKKLTAGVHALGQGQEVQQVPVETLDEIGKLASAFNLMLARRKQAEEALRVSERNYRTLFEESKDVVFIDTPDDEIVDINPAGVDLFGCASKEELLAFDVKKDLYLRPEDRDSFKKLIAAQGFVKDHEVKFRRRDGEPLDVIITATAVRDAAGAVTAYRGILRDVTAERSLEQQLRHSQKMEAVGRLTGGIAHDFNNILTAIFSYVYLLQVNMPEKDPMRIYVDHIDSSAQRAANLTRALLTFSRKQIMNPVPLELNEVIRQVQSLLSKLIGEDIALSTKLSAEDLVVTADSGQLEQVLMNFATNARDAMPRGGRLTITTRRAEIGTEFYKTHGFGEQGEYAEIAVTDTGAGIDQATIKKIFEPFFTTKDVGKGTGLGLSICYSIVKQHNGYITADSEPEKGTTFTVYLPLQKNQTVVITAEDRSTAARGTETILVGEDDEDVRQIVQYVLGEFGYKPIMAVDGEDTVNKFMEHQHDVSLLILDVIMPKKNGKEVYDEIRKVRPDMKVLFTSGYTANIVDQQGLLDEELHFISKPVSPRKLLRKVREVLDT